LSHDSDGGDDFFGGFDIVDSRAQTVESSKTTITPSSGVGVKTTDFGSKRSKFVSEIPIDTQTNDHQQEFQQDTSDLVQVAANSVTPPRKVERVHHPFVDETQQQLQMKLATTTLTARTVGEVCRFGGYAPISGCPKEATNGCVDRIPCTRKCENGGYFSWRCAGSVYVTPEEAIALRKQEPKPSPVPASANSVKELASRLELAMQRNDYAALARIILDAQQEGPNLATSRLIQTALLQQNNAAKAAEEAREAKEAEEAEAE
jgi:hypothetical protein